MKIFLQGQKHGQKQDFFLRSFWKYKGKNEEEEKKFFDCNKNEIKKFSYIPPS